MVAFTLGTCSRCTAGTGRQEHAKPLKIMRFILQHCSNIYTYSKQLEKNTDTEGKGNYYQQSADGGTNITTTRAAVKT